VNARPRCTKRCTLTRLDAADDVVRMLESGEYGRVWALLIENEMREGYLRVFSRRLGVGLDFPFDQSRRRFKSIIIGLAVEQGFMHQLTAPIVRHR